MQLFLHTVVKKMRNSTRSYCPVSTNLSHTVHAIWAHLQSVLEELPVNIVNIHFLNNGSRLNTKTSSYFTYWHAKYPICGPTLSVGLGHGKRRPDGGRATCKRTDYLDKMFQIWHSVVEPFRMAAQTLKKNKVLFLKNNQNCFNSINPDDNFVLNMDPKDLFRENAKG